MIKKAFPDKKIVIAETGWPSEGRVKKGSVPSASMEAFFIRKFVKLAASNDYDYYIIEAYDQPWKAGQEGAVGAFWGLFDADRAPKFQMAGGLTSFPQWPTFATSAAVGVLAVGASVLAAIPAVAMSGYLLLGGIVGLIVSGVLFIIDALSLRYVDWGAFGGTMLVMPAVLFTALVLLTETAEWALSLWRVRRKSLPSVDFGETPRVSIHVPTHNEPPQMVIGTLDALARLDYPNYEVIVLDNNTASELDWRPVEAHCRALGANFRFYHYDGVKGFKAGALNIAMELTDPAATFIGVIDSDYQVSPEWLKTVVPAFADPQVALVQAPQDYRDADESLLKKCCYEEYRGFFHVGMVERDEHNAIIQHGTMCMVRRTALVEVGGWAPWCITEDTELGLRLFEAGYVAHYTSKSLGRGLMPDTYAAYKDQRYRWVYGAMQILKRHGPMLFGRAGKLSLAQRYHFVAGWLPWFADAFAMIFSMLAVVWTGLMIVAPKYFDVPLTALSSTALALFTIKTVKTIVLHRTKVGGGIREFARVGRDGPVAGLHRRQRRSVGAGHVVESVRADAEVRRIRAVLERSAHERGRVADAGRDRARVHCDHHVDARRRSGRAGLGDGPRGARGAVCGVADRRDRLVCETVASPGGRARDHADTRVSKLGSRSRCLRRDPLRGRGEGDMNGRQLTGAAFAKPRIRSRVCVPFSVRSAP